MKKLLKLIYLFLLTIIVINYKEVKAEDKWIGECTYNINQSSYSTGLPFPTVQDFTYPKIINLNFNRNEIETNLGTLQIIKHINYKLSDVLLYYDMNANLSGAGGSCPPKLYAKNRYLYLSEEDAEKDKDNQNIILNPEEDDPEILKWIEENLLDISIRAEYDLLDSKIHPENDTNPPDTESDDPTISEIHDCVTLLGNPATDGTPAYYISFAFRVVKYVAIGLLIVLSTIDFISAVISQDNDIMKKTVSKIIKRFILCVVIFVLPMIIDFILQYINDSQYLEQVNLGLCGIGE